jgi:hypothetical protein
MPTFVDGAISPFAQGIYHIYDNKMVQQDH